MPRQRSRWFSPVPSVAQSAVPVLLPGLAAHLQVSTQYRGVVVLAGVMVGALLVMLFGWILARRLIRRRGTCSVAKHLDMSSLRSIALDGEGFDAMVGESAVTPKPPEPACGPVPHGMVVPPVLSTCTPSPASTPSPAPPTATTLKLGATSGPHLSGRGRSTPPPSGQASGPACLGAGSTRLEAAASVVLKPVSLHERIQAIDANQMVQVMRIVFERQGYRAFAASDGEAQRASDFALEKDGEVTLVSCRPAAEPRVGLQGVQDFAHRMGSAGIGKGLLLAVKGYTFEAKGGAPSRGITIMDGPEVIRLLDSVHAVTDPELVGVLTAQNPTVAPPSPAPVLKLARHD